MPGFRHQDLNLPNPAFDSPLVDVVTALERLRSLRLAGSTPAPVFFELKRIFHILESLGSARIEGNHTTLADYVESRLEPADPSDSLRELENLEQSMNYIEEHFTPDQELTELLLRELHTLVVRDLQREGDATPGAYRKTQVQIAQATHQPPEAVLVPQYMGELIAFINRSDAPKYDLIKVAMAHHRFAWIHPFGNGNGRVVRLLTYALLIKYGFDVKTGGRVLNPSAVFCNDRDRYYAMLGQADSGTEAGQEAWCLYVLQGMLDELRKVDRLSDMQYLADRILVPALHHARERELITQLEANVLLAVARKGVAKASDLQAEFTGMNDTQRSYQLRKLVERHMLVPIRTGARQYTVNFSNNHLLRSVIRALSAEGFIPDALLGP